MPTTLSSLLCIPEFRRLILSYVWFPDLREISFTSRDMHRNVQGDIILMKQLMSILAHHTGRLSSPTDYMHFHTDPTFYEILYLASRMSTWPLASVVGLPGVIEGRRLTDAIERRREGYAFKTISVEGQSCILFEGERGRDRAFFSDDHFPGKLCLYFFLV